MPKPAAMRFCRKLAAPCLMLLLTACGGKGESVQEMMGMSRSGPDAFNVVSRPPLSVPPEFDLRPPAPAGTPGPGEPRMDNVARSLVTGEDEAPVASAKTTDTHTLNAHTLGVNTSVIGVSGSKLETVGERRLMEQFGATKADPMIREQLTSDLYLKKEDESWLNDVIPSLSKQKTKDALDPAQEAEKLRAEPATKQAVKTPPTPVKDLKKGSQPAASTNNAIITLGPED